MTTARSYFDALLPLSGNPALADARAALIASIGEQDLKQVIHHALGSGISKGVLEYVAAKLLDVVVAERARKADTVPHDDDENDAQDGLEVHGSSSAAQRGICGVHISMDVILTGKQRRAEDPLLCHMSKLPPTLSRSTHQRLHLQTIGSGLARVTLTQHEIMSEHRGLYRILKISE
jgi:hypothetical protein